MYIMLVLVLVLVLVELVVLMLVVLMVVDSLLQGVHLFTAWCAQHTMHTTIACPTAGWGSPLHATTAG